jgi:hypothetical protein
MIANTAERDFEVIEITNEMPYNRIGGVGSVIESLMSGFAKLGVHALWYVADHQYPEHEVAAILARYPRVVLGNHAELAAFRAPVAHVHSYNHPPGLLDALDGARSLFTIHSLLAYEEVSNDVNLRGAVAAQEHLIGACDEVVHRFRGRARELSAARLRAAEQSRQCRAQRHRIARVRRGAPPPWRAGLLRQARAAQTSGIRADAAARA